MVFHCRRMVAPIISDKHFVPKTNLAVASGSVAGITIVAAVARGTVRTATFQVDEGSVVKAVHAEYWLNGQAAGGADTQFTFVFLKSPNNAPDPDATDMANLGSYVNKKNILFITQGVLAGVGTQSIPIIRDWIKIPKGKQRIGLGDQIKAFLLPTGEPIQICGMAIFKEYA